VRDELGPTAWAVYTLAKCGVKKNDPSIQKGLKWIEANTEFVFDVVGGEGAARDETSHEQKNISRKTPRVLTTYESAAIILMIEAVYEESAKLQGKHTKRKLQTESPTSAPDGSRIPEKTWKKMHERVVALTVGKRGGGKGVTIPGQQNLPPNQQEKEKLDKNPNLNKNMGGWRYGQANGDADLSATQIVLLGLRAASQAGYPVEKVSPSTWELAARYARSCQNADGGFGYQVGQTSNGSMTACGLGILLISKEQIELKGGKAPEWVDITVQKGMEWLDKNFTADQNPGEGHGGGGAGHLFYYLYGVERVGDLAGRKEFNGKDWYTRGATLLVDRQEPDGKWLDATSFRPHDVLGTTLALLFLKRATIPVVTYTEGK
jgi:hypothetical protein